MAQSSQEVAYEVALRRLDSQFQRIDVVDSKTSTVVGLAGTALGIFAGFTAVVVDPDEPVSVVFAATSGAIILAMYLLAMVNAFRVFEIGEWDERPSWDDLLTNANEQELETMQLWVAEGCVRSLKENEPKLELKTNAVATATRLALIDAILVAMALIGLFIVNAIFG